MNFIKYLFYSLLYLLLILVIQSCNNKKPNDLGYKIHGKISSINDGIVKLVKLNLVNNKQVNVDSTSLKIIVLTYLQT